MEQTKGLFLFSRGSLCFCCRREQMCSPQNGVSCTKKRADALVCSLQSILFLVKLSALFFYKTHHCPSVVLGIVKVTQTVLCSLGLEHFHVLGVETADEEQ